MFRADATSQAMENFDGTPVRSGDRGWHPAAVGTCL